MIRNEKIKKNLILNPKFSRTNHENKIYVILTVQNSSGNQYLDFKYIINGFVNDPICKITTKPVIHRIGSYSI